jgi:predicted ribosomally synthesized peptide with nif11-like leader
MSVKNVKAFFEKVEEDKALQEKLKALDMKEWAARDAAVGEMVEIAKTAGFVFTPEDFFAVKSAKPNAIQGTNHATPSKGCWVIGLKDYDPPPPPCAHGHWAPPGPPCDPGKGLYEF